MRAFNRRNVLASAVGATAALGTPLPAPAVAKERLQWNMVTSWPKGLPGLGTGAERLANRIGHLSGGQLTIKIYAAGELVPALQVLDAVSNGTAEMGHDTAYYHIGKMPAAGFFTAVPFGMNAQELNGWIYFGGGQELWDQLYEPFGIKAFLAGNTGVQMGGWFRKEIKSPDDLRGLKFRMPGQGGQVMTRLGATVVTLPAGEIFGNLQSGALDGAEWVGPYNDLALGFYKVTKFYYWPGFHEAGPGSQCTINLARWNALSTELQQIIITACAAENEMILAEYNGRSGAALATLVQEHGVKLRQFPLSILTAFGRESGALMQEIYDQGDEITRRICASYFRFRRESMAWTRIADQAYANARLLDFSYPEG